MRIFIVFVIFFLQLNIVCAQSVDETIKQVCGVHPVLYYLKEYKGMLMDPEMLTHIEECAKGVVGADVWKWKLADVNIQGCLIKKYKHQEEYINKIAKQYDEAKENVAGQIEPYNICANNVRKCGKAECINKDIENENPVLDPYNYEWKCWITIENEKRYQVAAGELFFGKVINEPKMSFARIRFSSKRTRVLDWEMTFDGAWTLGYFGECLEGECMGFVSKKEPHVPVIMVNEVDFDEEARKINISGVIMIKKHGKHKRYGFLSGTCRAR